MHRSDDASRRFAEWQFRLIAIAAFVWFLVLIEATGGPPEPFFFAPFFAIAVLLMGWLTWRGIAAVSAWWWYLAGELPDPQWARRIIQYETGFLWVFCAFNGSLITLLVVIEEWAPQLMRASFGLGFVGRMLPVIVGVVGNALLILFGLWRYRLAMRAIRWANF
jgi:hypothetical protein